VLKVGGVVLQVGVLHEDKFRTGSVETDAQRAPFLGSPLGDDGHPRILDPLGRGQSSVRRPSSTMISSEVYGEARTFAATVGWCHLVEAAMTTERHGGVSYSSEPPPLVYLRTISSYSRESTIVQTLGSCTRLQTRTPAPKSSNPGEAVIFLSHPFTRSPSCRHQPTHPRFSTSLVPSLSGWLRNLAVSVMLVRSQMRLGAAMSGD